MAVKVRKFLVFISNGYLGVLPGRFPSFLLITGLRHPVRKRLSRRHRRHRLLAEGGHQSAIQTKGVPIVANGLAGEFLKFTLLFR